MIVGILQAEYGINPTENLKITGEILDRSYNMADVVVLPEYSMADVLSLKPEQVYDIAEPLEDSAYLSSLSDMALKYSIIIVAHLIEKTDTPPLSRSTTVLIYPSGRIEPVYRKMHLFDAYGYRESDYFIPGESPSQIVELAGMRAGFAICYDIRFPELFRTYALKGAESVIVQAGWVRGPLKEEILEHILVTRAHENTMYIILSSHSGERYVGRSGVFSPYGYRIIDLGPRPGYAEIGIDGESVYDARKLIPVLKHAKMRWIISLHGNE